MKKRPLNRLGPRNPTHPFSPSHPARIPAFVRTLAEQFRVGTGGMGKPGPAHLPGGDGRLGGRHGRLLPKPWRNRARAADLEDAGTNPAGRKSVRITPGAADDANASDRGVRRPPLRRPRRGRRRAAQPNPLAPSLPLLTSDEENHLDKVIDRFMLFDTGQLKGEEGKTALQDFTNLGPESIPALIRGINRAAVMDQSCPTLVIAKKLKGCSMASDDQDLLDFAHDNIAAGIERSQHLNVLQDLQQYATEPSGYSTTTHCFVGTGWANSGETIANPSRARKFK